MLKEYESYILKLRDSLIQCGVGLPVKSEYSYEELFNLSENITDLLWFYSMLAVSSSRNSLKGFILPLNNTTSGKIRSQFHDEYIDEEKLINEVCVIGYLRKKVKELDEMNHKGLSSDQSDLYDMGDDILEPTDVPYENSEPSIFEGGNTHISDSKEETNPVMNMFLSAVGNLDSSDDQVDIFGNVPDSEDEEDDGMENYLNDDYSGESTYDEDGVDETFDADDGMENYLNDDYSGEESNDDQDYPDSYSDGFDDYNDEEDDNPERYNDDGTSLDGEPEDDDAYFGNVESYEGNEEISEDSEEFENLDDWDDPNEDWGIDPSEESSLSDDEQEPQESLDYWDDPDTEWDTGEEGVDDLEEEFDKLDNWGDEDDEDLSDIEEEFDKLDSWGDEEGSEDEEDDNEVDFENQSEEDLFGSLDNWGDEEQDEDQTDEPIPQSDCEEDDMFPNWDDLDDDTEERKPVSKKEVGKSSLEKKISSYRAMSTTEKNVMMLESTTRMVNDKINKGKNLVSKISKGILKGISKEE